MSIFVFFIKKKEAPVEARSPKLRKLRVPICIWRGRGCNFWKFGVGGVAEIEVKTHSAAKGPSTASKML